MVYTYLIQGFVKGHGDDWSVREWETNPSWWQLVKSPKGGIFHSRSCWVRNFYTQWCVSYCQKTLAFSNNIHSEMLLYFSLQINQIYYAKLTFFILQSHKDNFSFTHEWLSIVVKQINHVKTKYNNYYNLSCKISNYNQNLAHV